MIEYSAGTVFNVDADAIVNTVNCDGFMGAGLAMEFSLRYPKMNRDYVDKCSKQSIMVGQVDYYLDNGGPLIINFPTKFHFRNPSKLSWIEAGLKYFAATYKQYEIHSVAFPKLGTSNGGLNWDEVKNLMERYLSDLSVDVIICTDELSYAEGIEKEMLEAFNNISLEELSKHIRLNKKQKEVIENRRPYNRFWKISRTDGIGSKTYKSIFTYFYEIVSGDNAKQEQLSLFD